MISIEIPENAFHVVVHLMAFLNPDLCLDKWPFRDLWLFRQVQNSSSSYTTLPEYSFAYEPPSYGAPPL